jgi:hypothetical protein
MLSEHGNIDTESWLSHAATNLQEHQVEKYLLYYSV